MSTLNVSNITDGTTTLATEYVVNGSAKAWVNFNGTGTIAARDSLNVSSLTDNGTGIYTVNFTSIFAAADYSIGGNARYRAGVNNEGSTVINSQVAASAQIMAVASAVLFDSSIVCANAHGDLA